MIEKKSGLNNQESQELKDDTSDCACIADPFTSLPPEMLPKQKTWKSKFRKVTCPGCGLIYWTNRQTDLCNDCEKKVHNTKG